MKEIRKEYENETERDNVSECKHTKQKNSWIFMILDIRL